MPDRTDPTRDLLRRAYRGDDLDTTAGLLDVLRRADPPPIEIPVHRPSLHPPTLPVSRRNRLPVVAAFAAAILVILIGVAVTARAGGGDRALIGSNPSTAIDGTSSTAPPSTATPTPSPSTATSAPSPSTATSAPPRPTTRSTPGAMPTPCAADWALTMTDREFHVTERFSGCTPLPIDRLYLADVAQGNGLIVQGNATVWPLTPTGVTTPTVSAPFTFTVAGWPGPIAGHEYEVWYAGGEQTAQAGDDAVVLYQTAYHVSLTLPYPCVADPAIHRTC